MEKYPAQPVFNSRDVGEKLDSCSLALDQFSTNALIMHDKDTRRVFVEFSLLTGGVTLFSLSGVQFFI